MTATLNDLNYQIKTFNLLRTRKNIVKAGHLLIQIRKLNDGVRFAQR